MKKNKIFLFSLFLTLFNFLCGPVFAGTGGANDGQVMLLAILVLLLAILGILFFLPILIHWIKNFWNKYNHC